MSCANVFYSQSVIVINIKPSKKQTNKDMFVVPASNREICFVLFFFVLLGPKARVMFVDRIIT